MTPEASRRRARKLVILHRRRRRERARRGGGMPIWAWPPLALAILGLALLGGAAGAVYTVYQSYAEDLVEPEAILVTDRVLGTSKIYDRSGPDGGALLYEFADPFTGLRNPISITEISPNLINATVSTEDSTFFENQGVNLRGLLRAAIENAGLGDVEFFSGTGGSSITQQLVKNILISPEERSQRTVSRKIKETILALELTERFSKPKILEWYLNTIFYGNLAYGVGAASLRYFGKPPSDLSLAEAALLTGLPAAPAIYDPFTNPRAAKQRQTEVLDLMVVHDYISQAQADAAKREPLSFASQRFEIDAPHFVLYVREQVEALCQRGRIPLEDTVRECSQLLTEGGLRITTTLDMDLQTQAEEILRTDLASFEEQTGAHNAALVAIDPQSGEILVMVGSRDFFREEIDGQVNLATGLNSPGSAFKPITYVAAFLRDPKVWNPATVLWDVKVDYPELDGTVFTPVNFDAVHRGPVTVRSALANSMNIPAFRTAATLGTEYLLSVAHRMGITTMQDPSQYGPAITLGGGDVSLLDLAYAYSVLANNGVMRGQRTALDLPPGNRDLDPIAILEIRDVRGRLLYQQERVEERPVIPAAQAYQITDILSDNSARAILYGFNSTLVLDRPVAAKTGTAGDPDRNDVRRDFWTMGYTPDLVAGVWVGNADNTPMTGGTSSKTAGLIWHDFMLAAHAGMPPRDFSVPAGLTTAQVILPALAALEPAQRRDAKLQDPCANRGFELFVADAAPEIENGFCTKTKIDSRTLLLATEEIEEAFVREGYYLIPPVAEGQEKPDPEIIKWLRANRVQYVVDEDSSEAAVIARIDTPPEGAEIAPGIVLIRGHAMSADLIGWVLSYAPGEAPREEAFILIGRNSVGIETGQLGRWDARALAPGAYVIRLEVEEDFRGKVIVDVHVTIVRAEEDIGSTPPGEDNAPPGEDNAPPGEDNAPPGEDNAPPGEDNAPSAEDNAPPAEDNAPPGEDNAPPAEDNAPPAEEPPA